MKLILVFWARQNNKDQTYLSFLCISYMSFKAALEYDLLKASLPNILPAHLGVFIFIIHYFTIFPFICLFQLSYEVSEGKDTIIYANMIRHVVGS